MIADDWEPEKANVTLFEKQWPIFKIFFGAIVNYFKLKIPCHMFDCG